MAIVDRSANFKKTLKTIYETEVVKNRYQNSVTLESIKKSRWNGGEVIEYLAQTGNGGNYGAQYDTLVDNPSSGAQYDKWQMTQGYATGWFKVDQPDNLMTAYKDGAFLRKVSGEMAATFDGISKTIGGAYLFGGKHGALGKVVTAPASAVAASGNVMTVQHSARVKMGKGLRFQVMSGEVPNESNIGTAVYTVTSINGDEITFSASVAGETIAAGDTLILYTAYLSTAASGSKFLGMEGLPELIPCYGDRNSAAWETYIATNFRGVDRSSDVEMLAGQFVKADATGDTRYADALFELLGKTMDAGGRNNRQVISTKTWAEIGKQLGVSGNLWQAFDNSAASKTGVTIGMNNLATAFGDSFIGRTTRDVQCPDDLAYQFEMDDLEYVDLGNIDPIINGTSQGQVGLASIEQTGDQGFGETIAPKINENKLFNVEFGAKGTYGPAVIVSCNAFGNFRLRKTGSAGVAKLD